MKAEVDRFDSGWIGVTIELRPDEISDIIDRLHRVRSGDLGHFHFRANAYEGDPGIASIEFSCRPTSELGNMAVE